MSRLAGGERDALVTLRRRHAPAVLNISAQTIGRAAAEEICQDVFLTVWRNAAAFDPQRGNFRPWVLRIAHLRVLNELRRRSRRPQTVEPSDGVEAADPGPSTDEAAWRSVQRTVLQSAVASLPPDQRQAVSLAFFGDLTHEQVADRLGVPLGTAKTRIRRGLRRLQPRLVALGAAAVAILVIVAVTARATDPRPDPRLADALDLVTSSDTTGLRLVAAVGQDPATHAVYRSQPGSSLAVFTLSNFPPAPDGSQYVLWTGSGSNWTALATSLEPDADGTALVIIELTPSATMPSQLQITLEPDDTATTPTGPTIVSYPAAPAPDG